MDSAIVVALISGGITALTTVLAVVVSNEKNNALQDERDKVMKAEMETTKKETKEEINKLASKVEQHNNFGLQLARLETRVEILERR